MAGQGEYYDRAVRLTREQHLERAKVFRPFT